MNFEKYIDVPEEIRSAINFVGTATHEKGSIHFECASWETCEGSLYIYNALVDTSERYEGVLLKPRWTFLKEIVFGGKCFWTIRPFAPEEK